MKISGLSLTLGLCASGTAAAGGLLLPGSGAVSTSRAGTGVASTEGGEAISLNPAGITKSKGTTITFGLTAINYAMSFQRSGTYDTHDQDAEPFEGQPYPLVENDPSPPLGIGKYQPVPVIAIVSDFGGAVPGLHAGIGIYAPNAYPFRNMNSPGGNPYFVPTDAGGFTFPGVFGAAPPPTRYDIIEQEAAIVLPSVAVAYKVLPELDVGARFSAGFAHVKSTVAIWGEPANLDEFIKKDGVFTLDAKDSFVLGFAFGANYRPAPAIELGFQLAAPTNVTAKGIARNANGPAVSLNGQPLEVSPSADTRCAPGGTKEELKGCVQFSLPMTATLGARYKILGDEGKMNGDVEVNVDWQHWGKTCDFVADPGCHSPGDYRVVVDAQVAPEATPQAGINLKDNIVAHGLKDTYGVRLGGSWNFPAGANTVIARGGVGYETAAAKPGWERVDFDGAAHTMLTVGGSFKASRFQIDAGFGAILQGTRTKEGTCNPVTDTSKSPPYTGCGAGGAQQAPEVRQGPDPINPIVNPNQQLENPVNQGTMKSHYLMFMLGMSTWF